MTTQTSRELAKLKEWRHCRVCSVRVGYYTGPTSNSTWHNVNECPHHHPYYYCPEHCPQR